MKTINVTLSGGEPSDLALIAITLNDVLRARGVDVKVDVPGIPSWEPANRVESDKWHTQLALCRAADSGLSVAIGVTPGKL